MLRVGHDSIVSMCACECRLQLSAEPQISRAERVRVRACVIRVTHAPITHARMRTRTRTHACTHVCVHICTQLYAQVHVHARTRAQVQEKERMELLDAMFGRIVDRAALQHVRRAPHTYMPRMSRVFACVYACKSMQACTCVHKHAHASYRTATRDGARGD